MAGWYAARRTNMSAKAVIALTLLAVVLVAAVPVALVVGVLLMLLGHVIGGLALFGGSILAATAAIVLAGVSGVRHLRRMIAERSFYVERDFHAERDFRVLPLGNDDYTYVS
jgi:uncharacterized membrane protein YdjX (TVP38/TMEM64 family)